MAEKKMTVRPESDALLVVDVQNDFCPGGALAVPEGNAVVPVINTLLARGTWRLTVATRDWHPADHCSFRTQGGTWPPHCIAGTRGAEFHPDLDRTRIQEVVSKATSREKDAYSGFEETELLSLLTGHGVTRAVVTGLATDYCVRATALDARKVGLAVLVVTDAVRAVEVKPGDGEKALAEMKAAGITLVFSKALIG